MPAASPLAAPAAPAAPAKQTAKRLIEFGVHQLAGMSAAELRVAVDGADSDNALLVMHPHHAPASQLVP